MSLSHVPSDIKTTSLLSIANINDYAKFMNTTRQPLDVTVRRSSLLPHCWCLRCCKPVCNTCARSVIASHASQGPRIFGCIATCYATKVLLCHFYKDLLVDHHNAHLRCSAHKFLGTNVGLIGTTVSYMPAGRQMWCHAI